MQSGTTLEKRNGKKSYEGIDEVNPPIEGRADAASLSKIVMAGSPEEVITAIRATAEWLAKYHGTVAPGLRIESPCERIGILEIARVLANAAAECPDHCSVLISMLHQLQAIAPQGNSSSRLVPLHGDFRPARVFIDAHGATVVGIGSIGLSDPAKEVARFVNELKRTCVEGGYSVQHADELVQEFLITYEKLAPSSLQNLAYFRALEAFKAFGKLLLDRASSKEQRETLGKIYRTEFEQATQGSVQCTDSAPPNREDIRYATAAHG
jgi:aminoglycoside phosphotransferase (APT) family kinase protein